MLAGAFATTPVQNIVTRKQTAAVVFARDPTSSVSPKLSVKDIVLQIRHEKGFLGFWSGYSASLVLTLNLAIIFLLHSIPENAGTTVASCESRCLFNVSDCGYEQIDSVKYPLSLLSCQDSRTGLVRLARLRRSQMRGRILRHPRR